VIDEKVTFVTSYSMDYELVVDIVSTPSSTLVSPMEVKDESLSDITLVKWEAFDISRLYMKIAGSVKNVLNSSSESMISLVKLASVVACIETLFTAEPAEKLVNLDSVRVMELIIEPSDSRIYGPK
jgi:hypothetical protein